MDAHLSCTFGYLLSHLLLSKTRTRSSLTDEEKANLPSQTDGHGPHYGKHLPYHGFDVPLEASISPEDSTTWYADFFDLAWCARSGSTTTTAES